MFEDKTVAITGATGGIGRALAEMFADAGADVAISDLRAPTETADEVGALAFACDVSQEAQVRDFIDDAEAAFGPVDIFCANAGVGFGDGGHAGNADNAAWETSWQVNVMQSVYAMRALATGWGLRGEGRLVVTASAAGLLSQIGSASYTATKAAAVAFAESVAITHADDGIKVNCICPQYVATNMTEGMDFGPDTPHEMLQPTDVAEALRTAIAEDSFLVLPHAIVADYRQHKISQPDAWIGGMAKLRRKIGANGGAF